MEWHRKYRILHFLEVFGDLFYRGLRRGMIGDLWAIIQIAWILTRKEQNEQRKE